MSDEMSDEIRVQCAHRGGQADPTHGLQSLHEQLSPLEQLMEHEEGEKTDIDKVRSETMKRLMNYIFADGKPKDPKFATRRLYALAKSYYPGLIHGMTLEQLGEVFGEANPQGHRARWSARIKKQQNEVLEKNGAVAKAKFQKSATAGRTYSEAQMGNSNRKK